MMCMPPLIPPTTGGPHRCSVRVTTSAVSADALHHCHSAWPLMAYSNHITSQHDVIS
jgi:hypothetical protein